MSYPVFPNTLQTTALFEGSQVLPGFLSDKSNIGTKMRIEESWDNTENVKSGRSKKTLSYRQVIHKKSDMD